MKYVVFSDCHIDGISEVMDCDEFILEFEKALGERRSNPTGVIIISLGDVFDLKNSKDPEDTLNKFMRFPLLLPADKAYFIVGNHEDRIGMYSAQLTNTDNYTLIHHGYVAKYGKANQPFIPGCGSFMRAIKRIGVVYRKLFPWKLDQKTKDYLIAFKEKTMPTAKLSISGHIHPKELTRYTHEGCEYIVCPQGVSRFEV